MKSLFGYLFILFILFFYAFFFDSTTGFIFLAFFIIVPLISFVITIVTRKNLQISVTADEYVEKNGVLNVKVKLKKNIPIPTSLIFMQFSASANFNLKRNLNFATMLLFAKKADLSFKLNAKTAGNASLSVDKFYVMDYFRIFKLRIKDSENIKLSVLILPEILDNDTGSEFIIGMSDSVVLEDEEDNTINQFSINRISGYEHRSYIEGDSLKKVNWKISSKKGELMVRTYESVSSVNFVLALDYARISDMVEENLLKAEEHLIETMLSVAFYCMRKGIKCTALISEKGQIYTKEIENDVSIKQLAFDVVRDPFSVNYQEYDKKLMLQLRTFKGIKIIFSEEYNKLFETLLESESSDDSSCMVLSSNDKSLGNNPKLWFADGDYSIKHCG